MSDHLTAWLRAYATPIACLILAGAIFAPRLWSLVPKFRSCDCTAACCKSPGPNPEPAPKPTPSGGPR